MKVEEETDGEPAEAAAAAAGGGEENSASDRDSATGDVEEVISLATAPDPAPAEKKFTVLTGEAASGSPQSDGACNVHVVTRVRPINPAEVEREDKEIIKFPGEGKIVVGEPGATKQFAFHAAFQPGCTQADVFGNCGIEHLLKMAMDGYACTAFAFGQTGSGKTFTMTGPVTPETTNTREGISMRDMESYGLIQFSFAYIIASVFSRQDVSFTIRASYLEIYNEQVQDLLNPSTRGVMQVRWSKRDGFHIENLFEWTVESLDDLMNVLEEGMANRAVAAHNVNEHSSRSHSILTVYLDSEMVTDDGVTITKHGKVSFVDLAGSEKVKDTGTTGDLLIETTNINRSLLTLGNCISGLSDPKKRTGHIPYRDSKLTKLLADSLGGSGITLMIACVTPSSYNQSETLNTLRYAKRARKIKTKPAVKIDPREEFIMKLQREMRLLQQENHFLRNQLEFPHRERPRNSQPADDGGAGQVVRHDASQMLHDVFSPDARSVSDNSLYEMLQEYMVENEALRNENHTLLSQHNADTRERRHISGENDKLVRKLEDLSRLMMTTPWNGSSAFVSRTTSGRSLLSFQTYSESVTPQSVPAAFAAWNVASQPGSSDRHARLPPLRAPDRKELVDRRNAHALARVAAPANSKWSKANTYASQFKRKQTWNRGLEAGSGNNQPPDKILEALPDFPMRNFAPPKAPAEAFRRAGGGGAGESGDAGELGGRRSSIQQSSLRDLSQASRLHADFHVRIGGKSYYPTQHHHRHHRAARKMSGAGGAGGGDVVGVGGALPQEAYQMQDISPRVTKELSATSLRRLNNQMRQEMEALDAEINSYTKTMQASQPVKKKVPAT